MYDMSNTMKVIICGDRNATFYTCGKQVKDFVYSLPSSTIIIHGGCRGVDQISGKYSHERGLACEVYSANWNKYGKGAGPIRNKLMLDQNPDLVVAFHPDINSSKGSKNMINIAKAKGVETKCIQI